MRFVFWIFAGASLITMIYFGLLLSKILIIRNHYPYIVGKRVIFANLAMLVFAFCLLILFAIFSVI